VDRFSFSPDKIEDDQPGIWRFRHAFGMLESALPISIAEGNTPLVPDRVSGHEVFFKLEFLNPTGSFKDRGSSLTMSFLQSRGVSEAVEDSSGNAGASFAAYAARSGIRGKVYLPDSASGPKKAQIEAYGVEVIRIPGPRSNAADAVRKAAESGIPYASHAFLPFGLWGYATLAYEIREQLGRNPGTIICPVGQGGLILGVSRGFSALAGKSPVLIGVQARACAPFWALESYGSTGLSLVSEGETVAEGIRVLHPVRGDAVLGAVESSQGKFIAVEESDILPGRDQLARRGLYVEPSSAVVWPALIHCLDYVPEPIVILLTGSGLKFDHSY
jgi:threonine synthase